jgi:hypothetical protein
VLFVIAALVVAAAVLLLEFFGGGSATLVYVAMALALIAWCLPELRRVLARRRAKEPFATSPRPDSLVDTFDDLSTDDEPEDELVVEPVSVGPVADLVAVEAGEPEPVVEAPPVEPVVVEPAVVEPVLIEPEVVEPAVVEPVVEPAAVARPRVEPAVLELAHRRIPPKAVAPVAERTPGLREIPLVPEERPEPPDFSAQPTFDEGPIVAADSGRAETDQPKAPDARKASIRSVS